MPEIADNQVAQINVVGRLFGQMTVNTFFYRWHSEEPEGFISQELALELVTAALSSPYQAAVSEDWKGLRTELKDPRVIQGFGSVEQGITGWEGNGPSPSAAPAVTATITRRSSEPGRSYRGRIFVPAVPDEWITDGLLNDSGVLAYGSLKTAMVTDVNSMDPLGVLEPAIFSKELQTSRDLTGATIRTIIRSQRRREVGVGV